MTTVFASLLAFLLFSLGALVASQNTPSVVCIAGQCVEGFSNLTIGAVLSASGVSTDLRLLPGQYTQATDPQLLHSLLTSSSASLSSSPGFANTSTGPLSLPLSLQVAPGLATYASANYSGTPAFISLPSTANASNITGVIAAGSLLPSTNTWAIVTASTNGNAARLVLWDAAPDIAQFPNSPGQLTLQSLQSASCSTPCSSGGICTAQGSCACLPGFTGSACEVCSPGFFGSNCTACPAGCDKCDDGIGGSGRCLKEEVQNEPASCNCLNGVCGSDGKCACNAGWTTSSNGTQCASCSGGFFLSGDGSCKVCALGCSQCADSSGSCITCKAGFTQSTTDSTQCNPPQSSTSSGTVCPDGSFSNGTACTACSPLCQTCSGGTSSDCIICGAGRSLLNGSCVQTDSSGVCQNPSGSTGVFVADNNKHECEACPPKCTQCGIPAFSVASTINQVQCTNCLPGFVLSNGTCIEDCPTGTFLDPKDNLTCTACSSSCTSCAGSTDFCLTCATNQLASQGSCVTSCPANTFSSSDACTACHPDCATCSGSSFTQCSSCPVSRPVLSNGRCLPTCSKTQYFDSTSGTCLNCDSSCSSCSGSGPSGCLACADTSGSVLRNGKCVSSSCESNTTVVQGLGACLSDLVAIPPPDATGSSITALPTVTGISSPAVIVTSHGKHLAWWEILLMALGCAFIVLVALLLWRRQARKKRAQQTAVFARQKNLDIHTGWKDRLVKFGERLFGHTIGENALALGAGGRKGIKSQNACEERSLWMDGYRDVEEGTVAHEKDMDKLIEAYDYPRRSSTMHSPLHSRSKSYALAHSNPNRMSDASMYTELTGQPRKGADARRPVRKAPVIAHVQLSMKNLDRDPNKSRFSGSTYSFASSSGLNVQKATDITRSKAPTPAEEYALSVLEGRAKATQRTPELNWSNDENAARRGIEEPDYGMLAQLGNSQFNSGHLNGHDYNKGMRGDYWLYATHTGGSGGSSGSGSKNPFRM